MHTLAIQLKRLLEQKQLKPTQLAKQTGIAQPIIHRLLNGKTENPQLGTLLQLAEFFQIELDTLIGRKDMAPTVSEGPYLELPHCPLMSYEWLREDPARLDGAIEKALPRQPFAIRIEDERFSPLVNSGYYIVIDPKTTAKNLDYLLIQQAKHNTLTLRQLMVDGDSHYLRPINPQLPSRMQSSGDHLYGVITHIIHCRKGNAARIEKAFNSKAAALPV